MKTKNNTPGEASVIALAKLLDLLEQGLKNDEFTDGFKNRLLVTIAEIKECTAA